MRKLIFLILILTFISCEQSRRVDIEDMYFEPSYASRLNQEMIYPKIDIDSLIKMDDFVLQGKYEGSAGYKIMELDIKEDNTFTYLITDACLGFTNFSKGIWNHVKDTIYLKSYDNIEDTHYHNNIEEVERQNELVSSDSGTIIIQVPNEIAILFNKKFIINNYDLIECNSWDFDNEVRYKKVTADF